MQRPDVVAPEQRTVFLRGADDGQKTGRGLAVLLDALQAAADFDRAAADARRRGVFDGGPGAWLGRLPALVAGFVARALVGLGLLSFVWKLVVGPAARRGRPAAKRCRHAHTHQLAATTHPTGGSVTRTIDCIAWRPT